MKEYEGDDFTGNIVRAVVMYITDYAQQDGYVVMSIELEVESREGWVTKEQLDTPLCDIFEGTKTNRTVREYVIMCEGFLEKEHVILESMPYERMNRYIDYLSLRMERVERMS